jgi:predicted ATPase
MVMQRAVVVPSSLQRSEARLKNNLPLQCTTLIGREHELGVASALLKRPDVRLLTVAPFVLLELSKNVLPDADVEALSRYAAVQLFLQRTQAIKPDFEITGANARAIAEICVQLAGLPLSIELAAARIRLLSPDKLLARLKRRLDVLTGGARDMPERQQALRNTIKWSYDLLNAGEQQLFRRLAVFAGGCALEVAEAIVPAAGHLEISVLDGLTTLLNSNLLRQREVAGGEPRLIMLETIREYALDCLEMSGETEVTRRAHADYYVALLDESNQELRQDRDASWLSRLEQEHDNLRAALSWLIEREEAEKALRLGSSLRWFWERHGFVSEGRQWLERALGRSSRASASVRGKALTIAGELAYMQGAYDRTEALCKESMALFQTSGDRYGRAANLTLLGCMERSRGHYEAAYVLQEESLAVYGELEDPEGITNSLILLGSILTYQGKYARASMLVEDVERAMLD